MLRVAIVGGGPCGIYALRELLAAERPVSITLFETSAKPGLGTPYDPLHNPASLLANIASFELPPVVEPLCEWLRALSPKARMHMGVGEVSEREFYPRVVLGEYFTSQYRKLQRRARRIGRPLALRAATEVVDIAGEPSGVRIDYIAKGGALTSEDFDTAIIATGHRSRKPRRSALTRPAYPPPRLALDRPIRAAVLGASLTAIDAALAMAFRRGEFVEGDDGLAFRLRSGAAPLNIELLSRRGVLPEADFYFPYPYRPLTACTPEALRGLADARLDAAFDLLRADLGREDFGFARAMGLDELTADSFADAYFTLRASGDPFAASRRNLSEARADAAARRVSGYRYVLLRAHESFAELVPHLSKEDRERFRLGLQRVFVDNYAAVPPLSVERLLALHDAGVLSLRRIASDYELRRAQGGRVEIAKASGSEVYDLVVDARGERAAEAREIPFPTLRVQTLANQMMARTPGGELAVTSDYRLSPGINPVERIFCLAAPFLLPSHPFVQGLTSAEEMAVIAVRRLLENADAPPAMSVVPPMATGALYLGGGLVVATPAG